MSEKNYGRYALSFGILGAALLFLVFLNINSGSVSLSPGEVLAILRAGNGEETAQRIVWEIRLPRILAAVLLGGALSVSGFLLQTFFQTLSPARLSWGFPRGRSFWWRS